MAGNQGHNKGGGKLVGFQPVTAGKTNIPTAQDTPSPVEEDSRPSLFSMDRLRRMFSAMPSPVPAADSLPAESPHVESLSAAASPSPAPAVHPLIPHTGSFYLNEPVLIRNFPGEDSTAYLAGYGYDPHQGRLEIEIHDSGRIRHEAFQYVPEDYAYRLKAGDTDVLSQIRYSPEYQYLDEVEEEAKGAAARCPDCGEWADNQHACDPASPEPEETPAVPLLPHHPLPSSIISSYGWDKEHSRLEVMIVNEFDGQPYLHVYRYPFPDETITAFIENPYAVWKTEMSFDEYDRARHRYAYEYFNDDDNRNFRNLCGLCNESSTEPHQCKGPYRTQRLSSSYASSVEVPSYDYDIATGELTETPLEVPIPFKSEMEGVFAIGPRDTDPPDLRGVVVIDVFWTEDLSSTGERFEVEGDVKVRMRDGEVQINSDRLRCSCREYRENYHCLHVDTYIHAIRVQLDVASPDEMWRHASQARGREWRKVQQRIEKLKASDWATDDVSMHEARRMWRETDEGLYSEDPVLFLADMEVARKSALENKGKPNLPYIYENVLDGACQRGSGQAFGIEIEYDFPPGMSENEIMYAQRRIGEMLFEAGITFSPDQQRYRTSAGRGFIDTHTDDSGKGTWCWEHDGSVSGEIVSPGCYDEKETWERVRRVLSILRVNDAVASARAGAHVHVGTAAYSDDPEAYLEMARLVTQHEDVLARLSSNPFKGKNRSGAYSVPLPTELPPEGFTTVQSVSRWQGQKVGRYTMVNFESCQGSRGDHVEIRTFDSSLDAGTVQAQIMMAVAMTNAAGRIADQGGTSRRSEPWGSHVELAKMKKEPTTPTSLLKESRTMMSFIDTLFRRREDKACMAALAFHTEWSEPYRPSLRR